MTDTQPINLEQAQTLDLAVELNKRYNKAHTYVISTAIFQRKAKRRQIVQHLKEGMKISKTDFVLGAAKIREHLVHDLWGEINKTPATSWMKPQLRRERLALIGDFAVMIATLPPSHRGTFTRILRSILPEDNPPQPLPSSRAR